MPENVRSRLSTFLRVFALLALSFAALAGGALEATSLRGFPRMAAALAGFAGYLLLFRLALGKLPVDWNAWLDHGLEGFRPKAGRPTLDPGRAA